MTDREAQFSELLDLNHARWRAIARAYAPQDADDLFQEILLQVWKSLPSFRHDSAASTWCYRIALNTALTWRRDDQTRRRRVPVSGAPDQVVAQPSAPDSEAAHVLKALMSSLSPADRGVLLLVLDDVSYAEMSAITGSSEGALRVRVHRIKERLAELAKEQRHDV